MRQVASRRTSDAEAPQRAMAALADRLIQAFAPNPHEAARLREFGAAALERLAADCSALDPGVPLDPARVTCLLLSPEDRA